MRHSIPVDSLGPQAPSMAEAVASCVHCGFCLPACPTYLALGEEMDSPRGRILLMKGALEGELAQEEVLPHVDRCLGCLACVTACPSGVEYGDLLTPFREMTEKGRSRSLLEELTRTLTNQTLPYPGRFRAAAVLGRYTKVFRPMLPAALRTMLDLLPPRVALPPLSPGSGRAPGAGSAAERLCTTGADARNQSRHRRRSDQQRSRSGHPNAAGLLRRVVHAYWRSGPGAGAGETEFRCV